MTHEEDVDRQLASLRLLYGWAPVGILYHATSRFWPTRLEDPSDLLSGKDKELAKGPHDAPTVIRVEYRKKQFLYVTVTVTLESGPREMALFVSST